MSKAQPYEQLQLTSNNTMQELKLLTIIIRFQGCGNVMGSCSTNCGTDRANYTFCPTDIS